MVGFDHPWFPEGADILVNYAFPECSLPSFAARHDPLCGVSETRSIVNVLAPATAPKSSPVRRSATHFATKVAKRWLDHTVDYSGNLEAFVPFLQYWAALIRSRLAGNRARRFHCT